MLFYNPEAFQRILGNAAVRDFLTDVGYKETLDLETALADLTRRCQQGCPHELGVFLGIPLPDVLSFIEVKGKKAVAAGYWKVYHNAGSALALFERYYDAKRNFLNFISDGNSPGAYLITKSLLAVERGEERNNGNSHFRRAPLGEELPVIAGALV